MCEYPLSLLQATLLIFFRPRIYLHKHIRIMYSSKGLFFTDLQVSFRSQSGMRAQDKDPDKVQTLGNIKYREY